MFNEFHFGCIQYEISQANIFIIYCPCASGASQFVQIVYNMKVLLDAQYVAVVQFGRAPALQAGCLRVQVSSATP